MGEATARRRLLQGLLNLEPFVVTRGFYGIKMRAGDPPFRGLPEPIH